MDIESKNAFAEYERKQEEKTFMSKHDDESTNFDEYEDMYKEWKEKKDNKYS